MKKFLLVAAFLAAISCSHQNQKVKLSLSFEEAKPNAKNSAAVEVSVFDDRPNKEIIGKKRFGDEKITISPEQNLVSFLQKELSENLAKKGFKKGQDRSIEIRIETLKYKAKRHFFIGTSTAEGRIKVIVKNSKTGEKFTKNFTLSLANKHFIAPLQSTDAKTINALLQELLEGILSDEGFLKNLSN